MTPGVRPLIAGYWKMHGTLAEAASLAGAVREGAAQVGKVELLVCPPFPYIHLVASPGGLAVGGQDCHTAAKGAHTGDVAAAMLKDIGADYVILGHSERRADHAEGDATVRGQGRGRAGPPA